MSNYFKKILIVDDDSIDRWILRKSIVAAHLADEIIEASSGAEAIEIITQSSTNDKQLPDLIFLDTNMPVLDGFGFLDAFEQLSRQYKNRCRVAVISAIESERDRQRAFQYESVIGYFEKPLKEKTLHQLKDKLNLTQAC